MKQVWQIIFCADCHEPTPPGQLVELFKGQFICPDCVDEILDNSEDWNECDEI